MFRGSASHVSSQNARRGSVRTGRVCGFLHASRRDHSVGPDRHTRGLREFRYRPAEHVRQQDRQVGPDPQDSRRHRRGGRPGQPGPGGNHRWHAHPSPVFVTVTEGSVVFSDGADPVCPSHTYTVGQTFIEQAYAIHDVVNSGGSTAQFYGVHLNPTPSSGPGFLIDKAKPTNCP